MSTVVASPPNSTKSRALEPLVLPDTAAPADRLFQTPQQFDFFQAVRLLEQLQPQKRAVGTNASPEDEVVRFKAAMGSAFPASSIAELMERDPAETTQPPEMTVA